MTADRLDAAEAAGPAAQRRLDGALGLNAWLVEELYRSYREDPASVSESWREFFADYRSALGAPVPPGSTGAPDVGPDLPGAAPTTATASLAGAAAAPGGAAGGGDGGARVTVPPVEAPAEPAPGAGAPAAVREPTGAPASAPAAAESQAPPAPPVAAAAAPGGSGGETEEPAVVLRGAAGRLVANMVASLSVPTATSVHPVPARLLEVNRALINEHLARRFGGKVSFTHLVGWAVVRALQAVPALNASFVEDADGKGTPGVRRHAHVGLGLATDLQRPDGSRSLVVPVIKQADKLDFTGFFHAYEDLVRRARSNKLAVEDFAGGTVTLTNPGTLGTSQSVPRLMAGQGAIIGVGALGYPAELASADPGTLAELGIGKVVTLTSTYDHRIIQGAESGLFLSRVHELLEGGHGFYDEVFQSLGVPHAARPCRTRPPPGLAARARAGRAREAAPGAVADQHVPGARAPHRPARPARHPCAAVALRARPVELRAHGVGPRSPVPHRRTGRARGDDPR